MLGSTTSFKQVSTARAMNEHLSQQTILVIEDDQAVAQLIRLYLVRDGHAVLTANDGIEGLRLAREKRPDLILLDLNLPGMGGMDVCKAVRSESQTPIVMVTARVDEGDRLAGLDLGADDYISKPFSPRELAARVRAILRRASRESSSRQAGEPKSLAAGKISVDLDGHTVTVAGTAVTVTPTEYRILIALMRAPGRVFSREQLIETVFGYDFEGMDRTVDTHISNLRRKIESSGGEKRIRTVYGSGYRFDAA